MGKELGRLEKVDLRDIWESEATEFTPWLAREENLALLGDALGLTLELEAQEKNVGPFRADILCKDVSNDSWVLIENQLEKTDHIHLGQILTYAAGLKAVTIIWVASRFTEEHRATLDWLNEITDDRFSFFGVEVELWKIGDSPVAPKFNIVSKPNDWTREVSVAAKGIETGELTETKRLQLEFWTEFHKFMNQKGGAVKPTKPSPRHWMSFSVGRSGFKLSAYLYTTEALIGCDLYIKGPKAKQRFRQLESQKAAIEKEIGDSLIWELNPSKQSSYIAIDLDGTDLEDRSRWPEYCEWLHAELNKFHAAFSRRVRSLDDDAEAED